MIKEIINKAYSYAKKKHKGQFRKYSDIPYFTHPKYVARIIEKLTDDAEIVAASLLHDTVEDTDATIEEIKEKFGDRVAGLVNELTNKKEEMGKMKKVYYMHKKFRPLSSDALLIKLADRLHNLLFLESDCVNPEQIKFIKYYCKNSIIIFDKFVLDVMFELKEEHMVLLRRIHSILDFFKAMYKF